MRYFVIGDDGQKYGPADIATLQSWIAEGRLLPIQQVEEEASGMRLSAAAVNGLKFPAGNPNPGPQAGPGVPTGNPYSQPVNTQVSSGDDGSTDATLAWVFGIIGTIVCCFWWILQPIALIFAYRAVNKGNPRGNAARTYCWVVLGIFLVLTIVGQVMRMSGAFPAPGAGMPVR